MSKPGTSSENHKCVFCGQLFPTKIDIQNHFRRHANGEIDIKGRPKIPLKPPEPGGVKGEEASNGETTEVIRRGDTATVSEWRGDGATCDVCGELFRTVSLAISHKFRKHPESIQKHYCPFCGMMFPIKVNRDKHLGTHPELPPDQRYPCLCCGVEFYNPKARKFHLESVHKGAVRMVDPIKTPAPSMKIVVNNAGEANSVYYCHLCGCEYQVKYNLQKHLATKHTQEERHARPQELVQCNLCSALFYTKRAYEAHNHHHREGDMFATNEMMRKQVVQRIDQDFDQRRVPTTMERYLSASAVSSNRSSTWRTIQAARRGAGRAHSHSQTPSSPLSPLDADQSSIGVLNLSSDDSCGDSTSSSLTQSCSDLTSSGLLLKKKLSDNLSSDSPLSSVEEILPECTEKRVSELNLVSGKFGTSGTVSHPELDVDQRGKKNVNKEAMLCAQSESVVWGSGEEEDRARRSQRMMEDSEEDDSEISSLGTVNPDTVMPNPGVVVKTEVTGEDSYMKDSFAKHSGMQPVVKKEPLDKKGQTDDGQMKIKSEECDAGELEVEKLVGVRSGKQGREFLVRWKGFEPADDTWEREEFLNCPHLIKTFLKTKRVKAGAGGGLVLEWYETQAKDAPRPKRHKHGTTNIAR